MPRNILRERERESTLSRFFSKNSGKSTYLRCKLFSRKIFQVFLFFHTKSAKCTTFFIHHFYQIWINLSKYNFGKDQEITIEIRRMTRRGWYDWDIGNGKFFSLSKDYFFNFRIKTHNNNFTFLNCTALVPCSIIVRHRSD